MFQKIYGLGMVKLKVILQFWVKKLFPWKFNLEYGSTFTKLCMHGSSRNIKFSPPDKISTGKNYVLHMHSHILHYSIGLRAHHFQSEYCKYALCIFVVPEKYVMHGYEFCSPSRSTYVLVAWKNPPF
jgi:hypothetical protein